MPASAARPRAWEPVELGPDVPRPAGAYSPAVRAGNLLFCSGQIPKDPLTGDLTGNDIATQTRQVMKNLEGVLTASGATLADVVAVAVYLADENDWGTYDEIHRATFSAPYPSRTVVGAKLRGGVLVEVTAIAFLG